MDKHTFPRCVSYLDSDSAFEMYSGYTYSFL